jgi:hypothetical protein
MKWAVMVPFEDKDYIYVTHPASGLFEVEPVLHDTYEQAREAASIWGEFAKIVEYRKDSKCV